MGWEAWVEGVREGGDACSLYLLHYESVGGSLGLLGIFAFCDSFDSQTGGFLTLDPAF